LLSNITRLPKQHSILKTYRLRLFNLLIPAVWSIQGITVTRDINSVRSQTCSSATLCAAYIAWSGPISQQPSLLQCHFMCRYIARSGSISQQPNLLQCHFVYRTSRVEWPHTTAAKLAPVPLCVPHISRGVAPYHSSQTCSSATLCTSHLARSGPLSQQPNLLQCYFVYRTYRAEWLHITVTG
jgi:hypothetical protein